MWVTVDIEDLSIVMPQHITGNTYGKNISWFKTSAVFVGLPVYVSIVMLIATAAVQLEERIPCMHISKIMAAHTVGFAVLFPTAPLCWIHTCL